MSAKTKLLRFVFPVLFTCLPTIPAMGASILGGTVLMDYDEAAFSSLGLTTVNSFDQASSNSRTYNEILTDPGTTTLWTNIDFGINPITPLSDPTDRDLQETSLTYDPGDLAGTVAGQIGIGGTTRWGGLYNFVLGDYALVYDGGRVGGIYSGWYLINYYGIVAETFELANVSTNVLPDGFSISGDLYVKTGSPLNSFFGFTGEGDYGNFSMTASTVPEPTACGLVLAGAALVFHQIRRRRRV